MILVSTNNLTKWSLYCSEFQNDECNENSNWAIGTSSQKLTGDLLISKSWICWHSKILDLTLFYLFEEMIFFFFDLRNMYTKGFFKKWYSIVKVLNDKPACFNSQSSNSCIVIWIHQRQILNLWSFWIDMKEED